MKELVPDSTLALGLATTSKALNDATLPDALRASSGLTAIRTRTVQLRRIWLGKLKEGGFDSKDCPFGDGGEIDAKVILSELPNIWLDTTTMQLWRELFGVFPRLARLAESRHIDCTPLIDPPMRFESELDKLELLLDRLEVIEGLELDNASLGARPSESVERPTGGDLAAAGGISDDTFRRVRDAAGIAVKLKGAAARRRRYSKSEVDQLIAAVRSGNFIERRAMAEKWAKWASNKAASKPHPSK